MIEHFRGVDPDGADLGRFGTGGRRVAELRGAGTGASEADDAQGSGRWRSRGADRDSGFGPGERRAGRKRRRRPVEIPAEIDERGSGVSFRPSFGREDVPREDVSARERGKATQRLLDLIGARIERQGWRALAAGFEREFSSLSGDGDRRGGEVDYLTAQERNVAAGQGAGEFDDPTSKAAGTLPAGLRRAIRAFAVGLSLTRVVVLAHWASDVVAGFALGAVLERLLRLWTGYPLAASQENDHADT
jgi:hypothetical protein